MQPEINVDFGKKPKKKFPTVWAVVITVVVVAGAAAGAYYYWSKKIADEKKSMQSQVDTLTAEVASLKKSAEDSAKKTAEEASSLKTYTNKTYGYLFKYPSTDYLIDYLYNGQTGQKVEYGKIVIVDKVAIPENSIVTESEVPTSYFMVSVEPDHEFGLSELASGLEEMGGELTDTTVDGEAAWKVHYTKPSIMDESLTTAIYVNHGSNGYTISWENSDVAGTHDAEIDAIVKSFKWL